MPNPKTGIEAPVFNFKVAEEFFNVAGIMGIMCGYSCDLIISTSYFYFITTLEEKINVKKLDCNQNRELRTI